MQTSKPWRQSGGHICVFTFSLIAGVSLRLPSSLSPKHQNDCYSLDAPVDCNSGVLLGPKESHEFSGTVDVACSTMCALLVKSNHYGIVISSRDRGCSRWHMQRANDSHRDAAKAKRARRFPPPE